MLALPVSLIPDSVIDAPKRSKRSQERAAEDTEPADDSADGPAAEASAPVPAAESDDEADVTVQVEAPTVEELKRTRAAVPDEEERIFERLRAAATGGAS